MTKKLWGGRFKKELDEEILKFSSSLSYDEKLAEYDIKGSIAHAKMLGRCKIISKKDSDKIVKGLSKLASKLKSNKLKVGVQHEDIHSAITNLLKKQIGKVALKLHAARSRNDQVALDIRMYCKDEIKNIIDAIKSLQKCFLKGAVRFSNKKVVMPSYTHLQQAQCILLSHQLLAYIEMFQRDKGRLEDAFKRVDVMPLGSMAHRGTTLGIDRKYVAKLLGFSKVSENSIDAVSDRDFVAEILSILAIVSMHTSRICEDFIIWSSNEFGYVEGDDAHYTGSSIMPNKKNPDPFELVRGYSGEVYGNLVSVLVMMKGLPLTYNRDMQLDKPALFNAVEVVKNSLHILTKVLDALKINENVLSEACKKNDFIFATDICEYLIGKGSSQDDAHKIAGKIVLHCLDSGIKISGIEDKKLDALTSGKLKKRELRELLVPSKSVSNVKSHGGTSPSSVKKQIKKWNKVLRLNS